MKSLIALLVLLFPIVCVAQTTEVAAVLNDGDVQHFIKTVKPMTEELEALGHSLETEEEEVNPMDPLGSMRAVMNAMMARDDVMSILKKYDWDESFANTYLAIGAGYSYLKVTQEFESMPEDQKAQAQGMIDMMTQQFKTMVHDDDIAAVQPHMDALDVVFESM